MNSQDGSTVFEILLVEDNPGDIRLAEEAFGDAQVANNLRTARDGEEALSYLRQEGSHSQATRPDLILLDLNLPKKGGREVLREIKADDGVKRIPVIILTTSGDEEDISQAYGLNASSYVRKPVDLDGFIEVVAAIEAFWMKYVKLPGKGL